MVLRFSPLLKGRKLNDVFYCWRRVKTTDGERFEVCNPNDYWEFSWDEYEYLKFKNAKYGKLKSLVTVSLRSKETFTYGLYQLIAKLPRWIFDKDSPMLWFGFEADDLFAGGVCHFSVIKGILKANVGRFGKMVEIPLDFVDLNICVEEKPCAFSIKLYESGAVWYVNDMPVAFAVFTDEVDIISSSKPYAIAYSPQPSINLPVLLDIDGGNVDKEWIWDGVHPWGLRVASGSKNGVIDINLSYTWDEKSSSMEVHPIPVPKKTYLLIEPEEDATLELYYLTKDHSSLIDEVKLRGNKLNVIPISVKGTIIKPIIRDCKDVNIAKAKISF